VKTIRAGSVAALAGFACVAGVASASPAAAWPAHSLWVSTAAAVSGGGTSCAAPGYNTIQAAVNAATSGQQIVVCAGTYTEQLQITKSVEISGIGTVTVQLPATPANATTSCDTQMAAGNPGSPPEQDQDAISICGNVTVSLTGITVDAAWPAGTCYDALYGIVVEGGATLRFTRSQIVAAGAVPLNGCQGGVGLLIGDSQAQPAQTGHLILSDSSVSGYQKGGIVVDGAGSTATIGNAVVTGIGATTQLAQNGIQVGDGAGAQIFDSRITGNECNEASACGPNSLTQAQAAGILIFSTDAPVTVTGCDVSSNDIGLYNEADAASPAPRAPTAVIDATRFTSDRYEAVVLDQGAALVENSRMSGGNVGLQALQYTGQTFGTDSVATADTITNMSAATVQVLSDQVAGDEPGQLVVAGSRIRPGQILNNSRNFRLLLLADS
jgi:Right handed beta helix region